MRKLNGGHFHMEKPDPQNSPCQDRQLAELQKTVRIMRSVALPLAGVFIVASVLPSKNARIDGVMLVVGVVLLVLSVWARRCPDSRVLLFGAIWTGSLLLMPIQNIVTGEAALAYNIGAILVLGFSAALQFRWHRKLAAVCNAEIPD